jgi:tetratricopeptide (TPR) repeat protein
LLERSQEWQEEEMSDNPSPLASFDPAAYQGQKQAKGDIYMRLENYRDLLAALKTVPSLDLNDPRLPATVEKTPKPFSKMLREVEFYLGQNSMQGGRVTIEVHHGLFPYATDGQFEYEVAKISDDGYLVWSFVHDPDAPAVSLYSGKACAYRIASDSGYSCKEKALSICPAGFCLFHMSKYDSDKISKRVGGVLWETFRKEYEVRFDELIQGGNYDCRGFDVMTSGKMSMCLMGHTFQSAVDFSGGVLRSLRLKKSVFQEAARFDRAVFEWDGDFGEAVFKGEASFAGAKFRDHGGTHSVSFRNTQFEGPVDFSGADFTPDETAANAQPFPSVKLETAAFKAGVKFNGATGIGYVKVPDGEVSRLLQAQAAAQPTAPSPDKIAAWRKELASVTEQLLKSPSEKAPFWKQKANLDTAIFEDQLRRGEDAVTSHLRLGFACFFSANLDGAKPHFQKCLELRKDSAEAMLGLARCELWWARTNAETEQLLLAALKKSPKLINVCDWPGNDLLLWVGAHYMRAGDPGRAVAYLRRAVELNPKGSMVNEYLGRAYLEAGYPDDATAALEREVAVSPTRYDPHIYLDPIYAARGNREKSAYHRDQAGFNNPGRLILGPEAVQEIQRQVKMPKKLTIPEVFAPQLQAQAAVAAAAPSRPWWRFWS